MEPPTALLENLVIDKWTMLEDAKNRAQWDSLKKEKDKKREQEREEEKKAFAEIDWQDFALVQTIEFTGTDMTIDLPPPMTIRELESMGLREKRMAAMIVEEVAEKDEDELNGGSKETGDGEMDIDMDEEEEEDEQEKEQQRKEAEETKRARDIQAKAMGQAGMKIRKDYVPKGPYEVEASDP